MDLLLDEALKAEGNEGEMVRLMIDITAEARDDVSMQSRAIGVAAQLVRRKLLLLQAVESSSTNTYNQTNEPTIVQDSLVGRLLYLAIKIQETSELPLLAEVLGILLEIMVFDVQPRDVYSLWQAMHTAGPALRERLYKMMRAVLEHEADALAPMRRSVFTMRGQHAGIVAPSGMALPLKKGYTFCVSILLDPSAPTMVLYSFRGENGHGVSAAIDGDTLVLSSYTSQGSFFKLPVPLNNKRTTMHHTWTHLVISHSKKMVFKDKITVYLDGQPFFSGNLPYPDALQMAGGQNGIGTAPEVPTFQGQMWQPTLLGFALSDAEVLLVMPSKTTLPLWIWENSGLVDKSKFVFSYDARVCSPASDCICYDVSGNGSHGWLEPGSKSVCRTHVQDALSPLGGIATFLRLLFDPANAEDAVTLLRLVTYGLRVSPRCLSQYIRWYGSKVVAFIVDQLPSQVLSTDLLDAIVEIFDTVAVQAKKQRHRTMVLVLFALNQAWFRAPFETQVRLLESVLPKYLSLMEQPSSDQTTMEVRHWCELMAKWYGANRPSKLTDSEASICCKLILDKIIDPILFPRNLVDESSDAWAALIRHIDCRMHEPSIQAGDVDIQEIFRYFARTLYQPDETGLSSPPSRKMAVKLQKHSPLAMWYVWLGTSSLELRLQVLHAFEAMAQHIHLRFPDAVLFYNSLRPYELEMRQCEVILDVSLGHRSSVTGERSTSTPRGHFIPVVLLKLLASADYRVQLYVLYELNKYIHGTNSEIFKEYIRVDPEWMKILVSIKMSHETTPLSPPPTQSQALDARQLNDYCMVLCDETATVEARIQIIQSIGASRDSYGADFMLTVLQHDCAPPQVKQAIIHIIIASFPSHAVRLVESLCMDIIVDILAYSLGRVNHGWLHLLEAYFYLYKEPDRCISIYTSVADAMINVTGASGVDQDKETLLAENRSQFAAILSLLFFIAERLQQPLGQSAHVNLLKKARDLWLPILGSLPNVAWDGGPKPAVHVEVTNEIMHELFATYPLLRLLALYTLFQNTKITLLTNGETDLDWLREVFETLHVIPKAVDEAAKQPHSMQREFLLSVIKELHGLWVVASTNTNKSTLKELLHDVAMEASSGADPNSDLAHALMGIIALPADSSPALWGPLMLVIGKFAVDAQAEVNAHVDAFFAKWKELVDTNAVFNAELTMQDVQQRTTIVTVHSQDCEMLSLPEGVDGSHLDELYERITSDVDTAADRFKSQVDLCVRRVINEPFDMDKPVQSTGAASYKLSTAENNWRMRLGIKRIEAPQLFSDTTNGNSAGQDDLHPLSLSTSLMGSSWRSDSGGGSLHELTEMLSDAHVRAVLRTATSSTVEADEKAFDEMLDVYNTSAIVDTPPTSSSYTSQALSKLVQVSSDNKDRDTDDVLSPSKDAMDDPGRNRRKLSTEFIKSNASDFVCSAELVRQMYIVAGQVRITQTELVFVPSSIVDEHGQDVQASSSTQQDHKWLKPRRIPLDDICQIYGRRYLLKVTALEIFVASTRKNYFFNFPKTGSINDVHQVIMGRRPIRLQANPEWKRLRHPSHTFRSSNKTQMWVNHEISTFEYLMWLNTVSGRTYNDVTQYPVFPWILADYTSTTLDLTSPATFRDLSKPMGALDPTRLEFFKERYAAFDDPDIPKFMYGSHYSHVGAVLYYLVRLEPFTSLARRVQGGRFDHADRLFHSIADTWSNCLTDTSDLKELTPEWFYLPSFLKNESRIELGTRQNGVQLNDVVLPPYASSPEDFIAKHMLALESEYVSQHIHEWIDLIFGEKQRGPASVEADNVFFYLTYEGMVDIDSIADPVLQASMRAQIAHFGQTSSQLLREPHVPRNMITDDVKPVVPFLLPHVHPITLLEFSASNLLCVDTTGMLSLQKFTSPYKATNPATSTSSSSALSPSKPASAPSLVESGGVVELFDRKCRRALPDTPWMRDSIWAVASDAALVSGGYSDGSVRCYSVADGSFLCTIQHHATRVTFVYCHGLHLACGAADGTISLWTLQPSSSWTSLLETLNLFRTTTKRTVIEPDYDPRQVCLGHGAPISCLAIQEDLDLVVSGSRSGVCLAHSMSTGDLLFELTLPPATEIVHAVAITTLGWIVVSSSTATEASLTTFSLEGRKIISSAIAAPGTKLVAVARTAQVVVGGRLGAKVVAAHSLAEVQPLTTVGTNSIVLSTDEKFVILGLDVMPAQLLTLALAPY
ncbi:hypothetical protein AeMF1_017333 [Aphanomyces euteiches]|nr:hypothetical protein AeMF1_017333 [Aphanomyces euteiches]